MYKLENGVVKSPKGNVIAYFDSEKREGSFIFAWGESFSSEKSLIDAINEYVNYKKSFDVKYIMHINGSIRDVDLNTVAFYHFGKLEFLNGKVVYNVSEECVLDIVSEVMKGE